MQTCGLKHLVCWLKYILCLIMSMPTAFTNQDSGKPFKFCDLEEDAGCYLLVTLDSYYSCILMKRITECCLTVTASSQEAQNILSFTK